MLIINQSICFENDYFIFFKIFGKFGSRTYDLIDIFLNDYRHKPEPKLEQKAIETESLNLVYPIFPFDVMVLSIDTDSSGNRAIKWDVKVLNHLEISANLIAILMDAIWKRKNKFIHEKVTITIHKEQIIHELKKTQMPVWETQIQH
ncbi:hypothetical protein ACTFIV_011222 [Dictyostelium citrinum]